MSEGGVTVVTDSPWGDSGKGKTANFLAQDEKYGVGLRWQGGGNSGHSVPFGDQIVDVHRLPSTLVTSAERPIMSVMGRGMAFSLPGLFDEIKHVRSFGIEVTPENLLISEGAQLTLPYHRALEAAREDSDNKSGTTRQAIAQTYGFARMYEGIRVCEIFDTDYVIRRLETPLGYTNAILERHYGQDAMISLAEVMAEIESYKSRILPYLRDEIPYLNGVLSAGGWILAEGAQSSMLDPDLGWYPHITGSNTWAGSMQAGCGIHYSWIRAHYLVIKAYETSVGNRPLIGQMEPELEALIQKRGKEFGVTSGRKRQCLWPNKPIAKRVAQVGMPTFLVINKGDVLTGVKPLYICTAYRLDGQVITELPTSILELQRCEPILTEYDGWDQDFMGATDWNQLPTEFRHYLRALAEPYSKSAKLKLIGTGPLQDHMVAL